jgi:hypothetical protein
VQRLQFAWEGPLPPFTSGLGGELLFGQHPVPQTAHFGSDYALVGPICLPTTIHRITNAHPDTHFFHFDTPELDHLMMAGSSLCYANGLFAEIVVWQVVGVHDRRPTCFFVLQRSNRFTAEASLHAPHVFPVFQHVYTRHLATTDVNRAVCQEARREVRRLMPKLGMGVCTWNMPLERVSAFFGPAQWEVQVPMQVPSHAPPTTNPFLEGRSLSVFRDREDKNLQFLGPVQLAAGHLHFANGIPVLGAQQLDQAQIGCLADSGHYLGSSYLVCISLRASGCSDNDGAGTDRIRHLALARHGGGHLRGIHRLRTRRTRHNARCIAAKLGGG